MLTRTAQGFRGKVDAGPGGATVVLAAGDRVSDGVRSPVSIEVRSGGQLSGRPAALVVNGVDYGRPNRGLQIVVLDDATGTPIERQVFDTHRTTSLRDLDFLRVLGPPAR